MGPQCSLTGAVVSTSPGVVASGAIWLSRAPAAVDREVRSGDVDGRVVEPLLVSVLVVSAIAVTVESALLRSDWPALSRTWLALFSAVPAGGCSELPVRRRIGGTGAE